MWDERPQAPVRVVDVREIACGKFAENSDRKDFLPSEIDHSSSA